MGSGRSAMGLVATLGALAVVPSALLGAGVSRAAASTCGSLSRGLGATSKGGFLSGTSFVSAGESWAVGSNSSQGTANRTLIERFNGSSWSLVTAPNEGSGNNSLNGVSMIPGAGWAVGYAQNGHYQPLALHWNGKQWSVTSPGHFGNDALFTSVDTLAGGSAWAVGFQLTGNGTRRTLIEHTTGGVLSTVTSPNDGTSATDNTLMGVSGTQATGLWAVGYRVSSTGLKPLLLRYDTTKSSPQWVSVSGAGGVPAPGTAETVLTGVNVLSATNVWAVGYYNDGSAEHPLALHWNGSSWSNSSIPGEGALRKVMAISASNVWAAGNYYNASTQSYQTLVVHFDGKSWTTAVSANATASDEVIGLAGSPSGSSLTLVGREGPNPLVEQANCSSGPVSLATRAAAPVPAVPAIPGVGPTPGPPANTPPAKTPVPVTITDKASAAGINGKQDWTFSAAVADINGDGWPDLLVCGEEGGLHLFENQQGHGFKDVSSILGPQVDAADAAMVDVNHDNRPDLNTLTSNQLAERLQLANGTFGAPKTLLTLKAGVSLAVGDVNGDNNPDIYVVGGRTGGQNAQDFLLLGNASGGFKTMTIPETTAGGGTRAYAIDYTKDGLDSFLVLNGQVPNTGPLQLLTPTSSSSRTFTRMVSLHAAAAR